MSEEQLQALEEWARAWSRCDTTAGRVVVGLVAEVRRLQAAALPDAVFTAPEMSDEESERIAADLVEQFASRKARTMTVLPASCTVEFVPPFKGVPTVSMTETVYGVEV